jgi:mono/diheme cytochrome c family protein
MLFLFPVKSVLLQSALLFFTLSSVLTQPQSGRKIITELACGACHPGVEHSAEIHSKAPSLSYAGLRYPEAYLYDYLSTPKRIRLHIGRTQMPDFQLSEQERLALVLFLAQQKSTDQPLPAFPAAVQKWDNKPTRESEARKIIVDELKCTFCHTLQGQGGPIAVDLDQVGVRSRPDWLVQYLALPQAFDPASPMPAQVYAKDHEKNELKEVMQGAGNKVQVMTGFLMSFAKKERERMESSYRRIRATNPDITADHGAMIFRFQNCAGCHTMRGIPGSPNAPDLAPEGSRVHANWLQSYLAKPHPIRTFGFHPGTGSRMPTYALTTDEVKTLTSHIISLKSDTATSYAPSRLSAYAQKKAATILRSKLSCLGCHQFDGEGGKVGPDISALKSRLRPGFVDRMIRDPQHAVPQTVMPAIPLSSAEINLLASFLSTREKRLQSTPYLRFIDHMTPGIPDTTEAGRLYTHYCSSCHGLRGNGDGFNARYLSVQPAKHSDPLAMSNRSDDLLFDGIHGGGAILNKSHLMPPFGNTLTREQIWSLVRYIRSLCQCEGPAWSQHGSQ